MTKKNRANNKLIITAIQMNSIDDVKINLAMLDATLDSLTSDIVVLPELFNYRSQGDHSVTYKEELTGDTVSWLKETAKKKSMVIIGGSIIEKTDGERSYNTTVVIDANGDIMSTYRKIHLFDVNLGTTKIMESNRFMAGNQPAIITVGDWRIGLSICYDLRFPELYRWYAHQGVDAVVIPSSFTHKTGIMHWHALCRARAIENQMYVIAPNQIGIGAGGEQTYGHSLIIDPYGRILEEMNDNDEGAISSELDQTIINDLRQQFPVINHTKPQLFTIG